MRIAIIADTHGNLIALEAVLKDLRTQAPDLTVNLVPYVLDFVEGL
jgi:predicted phosphodiesterase